jgi:predicted DNA binding CopG/RHH family protein
MRPLQYFSDEYLAQCNAMEPEQVLRFLEAFRRLQEPPAKSKLISLKVPEPLLAGFRAKCELEGLRYQSQIKVLMHNWLEGG